MERHEILEMLGKLQLSGMRAAYDEIVPAGVKRQHSFERIFESLLKAEIAEKHARSIRYQMGIAKLPLAKEIEEFVFKGTPINAELVKDLAGGSFLAHQRNVVLIGGTGSGKRVIWRSASPTAASAAAPRRATSIPSTWSTSSKPKPNSAARVASPTGSPGSISWYSMSSAICRLLKAAASYCST
jgi:hypothetical protein